MSENIWKSSSNSSYSQQKKRKEEIWRSRMTNTHKQQTMQW